MKENHMSITDAQIQIVQMTFAQATDLDGMAIRFYDRLFEIAPQTRSLFSGEMALQRMKLIQTLTVVVHSLDELDKIAPAIENLGRRHVAYGVSPEHWDYVGVALVDALADVFGEAFTDDVREAWTAAYSLIATTAINAAYDEEQQPL